MAEKATAEQIEKFKTTLASYMDSAKPKADFTKKEMGKICSQNCKGTYSNARTGFDIGFSKVTKGKPGVPLTTANAELILTSLYPEFKKCDKSATIGSFAEWLKPCKKTDVKTSATGGVDRLTDTSKYTGAHKERFDASGKGKGKGGREEMVSDTGYVGAYKEKDTYDKKH